MKYPSVTISAFLLWSYSSTVDSFSFSTNRISQLPAFSRRSIALFEQSVNGDSSAPFKVESAQTGPSDSDVHTLTVNLGQGEDEDPIVMQTGKIGRQAAGAVTLTRGDTVLFTTAARDDNPKEEIDFLPLSVEHQERFSAVGTTSGSYNKRDGRPSEHEILTCRLIDRPLRPLVADGWRHETQLLSWVMSYDGLRSTDPLAITAAATALYISDVPISKPVAGIQVGYVDDEFVLNPTHEQMAESKLNLILAGTKEAVLMIEGEADFLPEATMIEGVTFGHNAIKTLCEGIEEFGKAIGVKKNYSTIPEPIEGLQERVDEVMTERVDAMWDLHGDKSAQSEVQSTISKAVVEELSEEFPEQTLAIKKAFKDLLCRRMFVKAKNTGLRCDGRELDQVRRLDMETSILPRVHGSALFTRGETQSIATATLGDAGMKQKIDKLDGLHQKRFYLQYTFPPSCVGETGRTGMPGRREVGHGNLAERALAPSLPTEEDFPYTIRVESLITESHGSSSMASVCGGSLALMDAGVPVKAPVAGIAMGMLLGDKGGVSDENAVIVSDILGTEDALGTMDFKVAGNREGISTFQLDIKCEGLTLETMEKALEQARQGRLHILDGMAEVLEGPREELPDTVPKMHAMSIPEEKIGTVIGPGGKQIRAIIEDFELTNMNVAEDGGIQMTAMNPEKLKAAEEFITNLIKSAPAGRGGKPRGGGGGRPKYAGPDAEVGKIYKGKITGIHNFGVFMEILPGAEDGSTPGLEGLCHVSELHTERVRNCEGFVNSLNTEELEVKYLGTNDRGQLKLSRKEAMEEKMGTKKPAPPQQSMSEEEIDVIAQAIEGVAEM
mmetsp:Transcript_14430/g.22531  ORF Transcript_14430/g.22531 Transcript_14430/m.22531 type:complete len:838 (-) Transcript_14430:87-2600(-)